MTRISLLALALSLYAASASAGLMLNNTANSGDAGSAIIQTVTLTDGSTLSISPTR